MKKKEVENWVKNHKKELIIAGVGIGFVIATIVAIKNKDTLEALFASLKKSTEMPDSPVTIVRACQMTDDTDAVNKVIDDVVPICREPHPVSGHPRILHKGWKASQEKLLQMAEMGMQPDPGLTWVDAYETGIKVA